MITIKPIGHGLFRRSGLFCRKVFGAREIKEAADLRPNIVVERDLLRGIRSRAFNSATTEVSFEGVMETQFTAPLAWE